MVRLFAAALVAASAFGSTAALADAPIRLTAPADGSVLVPGRSFTIAWEPTGAWRETTPGDVGHDGSSGARIEEWEAFLSVDGGRSYAYRVTPHLDADVRTFHFPVPEVVSGDVRILIRMGDERREVGFEMPERFSIGRAGALHVLRRATLATIQVAGRRGEAARPGDAGVRTWVEGNRRGGDLRLRTAAGPGSVHGRSIESGPVRSMALLGPQYQLLGTSTESAAAWHRPSPPTADAPPRPAARAASILLLIQRSNR